MITEGWYIPSPAPKGRTRYPRWVLRATDEQVYYSKGGQNHYFCQAKTFMKWIKRVTASQPTSEVKE